MEHGSGLFNGACSRERSVTSGQNSVVRTNKTKTYLATCILFRSQICVASQPDARVPESQTKIIGKQTGEPLQVVLALPKM